MKIFILFTLLISSNVWANDFLYKSAPQTIAVGSDGTMYTQSGNSVYGTDGSMSQTYGNTSYGSDGSSATRNGNQIVYSDGQVCRLSGLHVYCD